MTVTLAEARLRTKIPAEELDAKKGLIITNNDFNIVVTGPTKLYKPDGSLLLIYLPKAIPDHVLDETYATLHELKKLQTDNRGLASGMPREKLTPGSRTRTPFNIASGIIGAFDANPTRPFCRLTAWTGKEMEKYRGLYPLFQTAAANFKAYVPERYATQQGFAEHTHPEWLITGTPFTTITVNNTYPTGVHTDKGDLEEGFSTIVCLRKGDFEGGMLSFVEYRVAVDLQHGDQILMDAHDWHGNTAIKKHSEDAERISVVCYYRTNMHKCGTADQELTKATADTEAKSQKQLA